MNLPKLTRHQQRIGAFAAAVAMMIGAAFVAKYVDPGSAVTLGTAGGLLFGALLRQKLPPGSPE